MLAMSGILAGGDSHRIVAGARESAERGRFDEAIRAYLQVLPATSSRASAPELGDLAALWGELGDVYLQAGEVENAIEALKTALVHADDDITAAIQHRRLGTAYRENGEDDHAEREFDVAESLLRRTGDREEWARLHREIGVLNERRGLPEVALAAYRTSLEIHEELHHAAETVTSLRHVASALQELGELPEAARTLERALTMLDAHAPHDIPELIEVNTVLGSVVEDEGDPATALAIYERALVLAEQIGYGVGRVEILRHMGSACTNLGEFYRAIGCYQQAIRFARTLDDEVALSDLHGDLGEVYLERGEIREAIEEFNKGLARDLAHQDPLGMAINHRRLGAAYQEQGDLDRAADELKAAEDLLRQMKDEGEEAILLTQRGSLFEAEAQYDDAIRCYQQSLEINERRDDEVGTIVCLRHLASVWLELASPEKAEPLLRRALDLLKAHGAQDRAELVEVSNLLGEVLAEQGFFDEARAILAESLGLARSIELPPAIADTYAKLGAVSTAAGDVRGAKENFDRAARLFRELGDDVALAELSADEGQLHERMGDLDLAVRRYQAGLRIARRRDLPPAITRLALGLARCSRRKRDLARASEYLEEILEAVDVAKSPLRGEIWIELGHVAQADESRHDEAVELYQQALDYFEARADEQKARECHRHLASVWVTGGVVGRALAATIAALPANDAETAWRAMLDRLDPVIAEAATPAFIARDYEAAVHMAFRSCETILRELAGGDPREQISVIAKRWFRPETRGLAPWVDQKELSAFADFWVGAIGARRNPQAHRPVPMGPTEAFSWLAVTHLMLTLAQPAEPEDPPSESRG